MADFRAGSNVLLGGAFSSLVATAFDITGHPFVAYGTACNASTKMALTLPSDWDGPFVSVLPVGVAIIYVLFGGFFGISGIFLLCNM